MKLILVTVLTLISQINCDDNNGEEGLHIEGDILASPSADGLASGRYKWDNGIVPYKFEFGYANKQKVLSAMAEFHKYTCIRYLPF